MDTILATGTQERPGARCSEVAETRDPGLVKEVMGHESLTTTMGYLHPDTAAIKAVIDRRNQQKVNDGLAEEKVIEQLEQQKYVM